MVESRQDEALTIIGIFTVLAFISAVTRIWSRIIGQNFSWDDYLTMAAMVIFLGDIIATWKYILLSGTGYHKWDLPKKSIEQQIHALKWNFSVQMFYHPLMGCIRASIIMFLFRMKDMRRRIRYSLHVVFWLNILYTVGTTIVNVVQCSPVRYTWSKPAMDQIDNDGNVIPGGKCIDSRTFILTSCALSIFMDLIIIPIPSLMVWNLQMARRTKILVVIVMSLGWVATGVSVGRFIVYYYRFAPSNTDRTWDIGISISIVEPAVHIMTACAPATKCLFRYLFPSFGTSRTTAYYEDRTTTIHTNRSEVRRASKRLETFHFGLDADQNEDTLMDPENEAGSNGGALKSESAYTLQKMNSMDLRAEDEAEQAPRSNSCSKTAHTEASEPAEAEPNHCLGEAR